MNLFEYEGKRLMRRYDIPVPQSELVTDPAAPAPMDYPFVLKAQVLTGGRGKAGGVQVCRNEEDYRRHAENILHMTIKGHPVHGLLAEQMMHAEKELYLSITLQGTSVPVLIFSSMGGMDIEAVSRENPDAILKLELDPFIGIKDYQKKMVAAMVPDIDKREVFALLDKVQHAFFDAKALLVEINPLGVVDGKLVAMDSKFVLDDHAKSMQATREELAEARHALHSWNPPAPEPTTITYVPLEGDVALISDGAGSGMLTLDLLHAQGLKVASFCELGGMTSVEVIARAMELSLTGHPEIKGVFISLIGGFNRMDNMAIGIRDYVQAHNVTIPIYTRMCGNMEEVGLQTMAEAGLKTFGVLIDAVDAFAAEMKGGNV